MATSPPRVKKEHYVPKLHLREWATNELLQVFDKTLGRQFPANIRDICSEGAFYDDAELDTLTGESQSLEKFFHGFEDAGAKVLHGTLDSIRAGTFSVLSESARVDLALFVGIQQLRTKRTRAVAGDLMAAISRDQFLTFIRRTQPDFEIEDSSIEMEVNDRARFAAQLHLVTDEEARVSMAGVFFHRDWWFLRNSGAKGFYTSDHPVVEHGEVTAAAASLAETLGFHAASAAGSKGIFGKLLPVLLTNIFAVGPLALFPLAPDILLVMLDRTKYALGASLDGRVQNMLNPADLEFYNSLQVLQATPTPEAA